MTARLAARLGARGPRRRRRPRRRRGAVSLCSLAELRGGRQARVLRRRSRPGFRLSQQPLALLRRRTASARRSSNCPGGRDRLRGFGPDGLALSPIGRAPAPTCPRRAPPRATAGNASRSRSSAALRPRPDPGASALALATVRARTLSLAIPDSRREPVSRPHACTAFAISSAPKVGASYTTPSMRWETGQASEPWVYSVFQTHSNH